MGGGREHNGGDIWSRGGAAGMLLYLLMPSNHNIATYYMINVLILENYLGEIENLTSYSNFKTS